MSLPGYLNDNDSINNTIEVEIRETEFLYEIGRIFSSAYDMKTMLNAVLELIARRFKILRGSINIYDDITENIRIDISYGYTSEEVKRGTYKPGEGIVGTVFKTGRPIVVPSIDDEPLFLNRTGARKKGVNQNSVFICVPIFVDNTVIGTISIDKAKEEGQSFSEELTTLSTVSIMIAHGVNERRHA
jgi:Nif-specific regulatory protein